MRRTPVALAAALAFAALCVAAAAPAAAQEQTAPSGLAVEVVNASVPTLCAEEDNVDLRFVSPTATRLRIEAVHPSYIGTVLVDRRAPDFTDCAGFSDDPAYAAAPRRVTLHETAEWQLVGLTFGKFWRPDSPPVRVGSRIERGLHLLQLWHRHDERAEEVLAMYPGDGYWRIRPLPPAHLRWTAYGSSFLVGPVEIQGRPIVDLAEIAFDPDTHGFEIAFARGGKATLRLAELTPGHLALDVAFDRPVGGGRPFAALRSMYVTETNADAARVEWRAPGNSGWREAPVMAFAGGPASALRAGRAVPSRHNTSAPDLVFRAFAAE